MSVPWVSPLPAGAVRAVHVYRPDADVRGVASDVCMRAWKGMGVRVFRWPCGTLALVTVGSLSDRVLLAECEPMLLATYARQSLFGAPRRGDGPLLIDVIGMLRWAGRVDA